MKKVMAKYNYAFGYVKSFFFFDFLFAGIVTVLMGIVSVLTAIKDGEGEALAEVLIAGIIILVVGLILLFVVCILFKSTLKKCPQSAKPVALALWMIVAGLIAAFAAAWWIFKHIVLPIIGFRGASSSSLGKRKGYKYALSFSTESGGSGQECFLYKACGDHAILKDEQGDMINVRPIDLDNSGGYVVDDSGNTYYPKK